MTDGTGVDRAEKDAGAVEWEKSMQLLKCYGREKNQSDNCGICSKCRLTIMNFIVIEVSRFSLTGPSAYSMPRGNTAFAKVNGLAQESWAIMPERRPNNRNKEKATLKRTNIRRHQPHHSPPMSLMRRVRFQRLLAIFDGKEP